MKDRSPNPLDERAMSTRQKAKRVFTREFVFNERVIGVEPIVTEVTLFYGTCKF